MAGKQPRQLQSTKHFLRNFLHINDSREFLVFLLFLLIAFFFWYLTTMTNEYEMKFAPTLKLKNVPQELIVIEPLPEKVEVTLKDQGDKLIEYKARGIFKELVIDYRQYANPSGRVAIHGNELNRLITDRLASSTLVTKLSLDTLQCYTASARGVKVPVKVNGRIEAGGQYRVNRIGVSPDSVTVYAASSFLDSLKAVYTPRVNFTELTDSVSQVLTLGGGRRGVKYVPSEVVVSVAVSPYVTKSIEVPITGYLFPYGMSLKTFPSKAKISFRISLEDYNKVSEKDFALQVNYTQIQNNLSGKIAPKLGNAPSNVTNIIIEPEEVDYLIEVNPLYYAP